MEFKKHMFGTPLKQKSEKKKRREKKKYKKIEKCLKKITKNINEKSILQRLGNCLRLIKEDQIYKIKKFDSVF